MRASISGTFTAADLSRLTWPVAWSGTVSDSERARLEGEIAALVAEAREALASDPEAVAVEIVAGEVVSTRCA